MKDRDFQYKRGLIIDNLLTKAPNKFLLSNAISGRAKQIIEGSLPYVSDFDPTNPIITALKELASDRLEIKVLDAKEAIKQQKLAEEKISAEKVQSNPFGMDGLEKKKLKKYAKK